MPIKREKIDRQNIKIFNKWNDGFVQISLNVKK